MVSAKLELGLTLAIRKKRMEIAVNNVIVPVILLRATNCNANRSCQLKTLGEYSNEESGHLAAGKITAKSIKKKIKMVHRKTLVSIFPLIF